MNPTHTPPLDTPESLKEANEALGRFRLKKPAPQPSTTATTTTKAAEDVTKKAAEELLKEEAEQAAVKSGIRKGAASLLGKFAGPFTVVTAGAGDAIDAYDDFKKGDTRSGGISVAGAVGATAAAAAVVIAAPAAAVTLTGALVIGGVSLAAGYVAKKIATAVAGDGKSDAQHKSEYQQSLAAFKAAVIAEHKAGPNATKEQHEAVNQARDAYADARKHVTTESDKQRIAAANQWQMAFIKEADAHAKAAAATVAGATAVAATPAQQQADALITKHQKPAAAAPATNAGNQSPDKLEGLYTIKQGDTLLDIADRLKAKMGDAYRAVDSMALAAALAVENKLHNIDRIEAGRDLSISTDKLNARLQEFERTGISHGGKVAYGDVKGHDMAELSRPLETPTRTAAAPAPARAS